MAVNHFSNMENPIRGIDKILRQANHHRSWILDPRSQILDFNSQSLVSSSQFLESSFQFLQSSFQFLESSSQFQVPRIQFLALRIQFLVTRIQIFVTRKYTSFSSLTLVAVNLFTCNLFISKYRQNLIIYGSYTCIGRYDRVCDRLQHHI